jgi:glycerol-3-phosphate acyltransferase PlsY
VALIVTAVWAVRVNRRWTLNVVTVFAGIHLYTQWFEFFGGSPVALVLMGLIALGLAVGMRFVNVSMKAQEQLVKAV